GQLRQLSNRMLGFGVHLVVTANRWSEIHAGLRDQLGTRLELRLGDAVESVIDIRAANNVPAVPGRGLTADKLHFLAAVPRLDGPESGKTNLLRLVIRAVIERYTPDEARIMLVDLRRELYETVPEEYRLGYAVSAASARQIIGEAASAMAARVPDETVSPEQL